MPYSTQADILDRIDQATLIQLTDRNNTGAVDSVIVNNAIEDADALINSLVSPIYLVPFTTVPRVIREHSATIAIYRIHLFRSVDPSVWRDAYNSSITFLQMVAERKASLEGVEAKPDISGNLSSTVSFQASDRKFSRNKLTEW